MGGKLFRSVCWEPRLPSSTFQKRIADMPWSLLDSANVELTYEIGDFATYQNDAYIGYFDMVFSEGGILHYFSDLNVFFG